jgi:hypothetical protein
MNFEEEFVYPAAPVARYLFLHADPSSLEEVSWKILPTLIVKS